ncbi:MAG TPA: hypothetical protein VIL55_14205 [Naasia sp.]|jgi:hypothetical protein
MKDALTGDELIDPETKRPIATPENLEAAAEQIRARLATRPVAGQVKTPDSIIEDLEWAKYGASQLPAILRDADRAVRVLQRRYSAAFVKAVRQSDARSADERRLEAEQALAPLLAQLDAAEVAYEYAKRVAKSVEAAQSNVQSQAAMVRVTYDLAGSGRGRG